ncbi:MAG: hypothetical protein RMX96_12150 [Nostoc sp. ChiSLP02]|nr:hypothetical protein [Nostoc sp. DedSLP05]MDZ8103427.1 hypothetical protein [Nostoc sp. DedSLP01]MDZ8185593.1 hypothetical protein [Nostoc sp. ChiSLP02]
MVYLVCNLLLQKFFTLEFYTKEISQGTLGLRLTSILLSFNFFRSLYNLTEDKFLDIHKKLTDNYPDLQNIKSLMDDTSITLLILCQNAIYVFIILLLWIFVFLSKSLLELKVTSWGLFFIVDDWAIISENLIALKGRVLKWHRLRILFFNGFLFIFIVVACFRKLENTLLSFLVSLFLGLLMLFTTTGFFIQDSN